MLPCVIFEDEHLLVVNKPAGWNTHAPHPYAGEGIYDWLKQREPRWATLAIIHRLDKETSGLLLFTKTTVANRALTRQFTQRIVRKKYWLLTDRPVHGNAFVARSSLVRAGEKYVSRPVPAAGNLAETHFRLVPEPEEKDLISTWDVDFISRRTSSSPHPLDRRRVLEAEPLTGRTHQIRVQAADQGWPILGDILYGGTPAPRVYLHAAELQVIHPTEGTPLRFRSPLQSSADERPGEQSQTEKASVTLSSGGVNLSLREALIEPELTDAFRLIHGASDGWPGWYVDRLGTQVLSQSAAPLSSSQEDMLELAMARTRSRSGYHKILRRRAGKASFGDSSPQWIKGQVVPEPFQVRENGLIFELSFSEGYSVGLFLDQRDNRRRILTGHVGAGFELEGLCPGQSETSSVLNAFAYTCAFSVCAAKAGARTLSLDLSRKYLESGQRNFRLNGIDPSGHDFILGDVFDWFRRLATKGRRFALLLLDPPTFSQSKASGAFVATKDYGRLVAAALPLVKPGGVLFASSNAGSWTAPAFLETVERAIRNGGRRTLQRQYFPQPPDFPVSRAEPAYLKSVWLRID